MNLRRVHRCQTVLDEPGPVVYSVTDADVMQPDGSIIEGQRFTVRQAFWCGRLRWHRGEHAR